MNKSGFAAPQILIFALALVAVAGGYFSFKPEPPVSQEQIVISEPAPASAISNPDAADWQTYRNEEHGFEFKYPSSGYSVEPGDLKVILRQSPAPVEFGATFAVSVIPNTNNIKNEDLANFAKSRETPEAIIGVEKIVLNNQEWLWMRSRDLGMSEREEAKKYYLLRGNYIYNIYYQPLNSEDFSKIFSTFKFIQ